MRKIIIMNFKKKILFFLSLVLFLSCNLLFSNAYTKSEIYDHWAGRYVKYMVDYGYLNGYSNGKFLPNKNISKEEVITVLNNISEKNSEYHFSILDNKKSLLKNEESKNSLNDQDFRDIGRDNFYKSDNNELLKDDEKLVTNNDNDNDKENLDNEIKKDLEEENKKIIEKSDKEKITYEDLIIMPNDIYDSYSTPALEKFFNYHILGKEYNYGFNPKDDITRGEFANILYNYLNKFDKLDENKKSSLNDIYDSSYMKSIDIVVGNGYMNGYDDNTFKPYEFLSRGEFAVIISKLINEEIPTELPPMKIEYTVLDVPYVSQLYPVYAPIGCEPTSCYAALKYKGYVNDVSHRKFLDNMPYDYINPNRGFVGHYTGYQDYSKRETIFPSPLANYAKKYGNAVDFSGHSLEDIKKQIVMGNPVVVYLTLYWNEPSYKNYYVEGNSYKWISNNHVVILCGYNPENNQYYVSDCYNVKNTSKPYKYWVDGSRLEYLYNLRKHAIVIK